jgi:acetyl-CoA carboxylase biotin carboxyl carrier protein
MTGPEPNNTGEVFEIERIRQLVELMEQHGLTEIDLRHEKQRIRLRRGSDDQQVASLPAAVAQPPMPAAALVVPGQRADDASLVLIKSPMVGTFYSRPNPEAETFVRVGDHVSSETTVCIIEAMKVFNEIPAEVSGMIVAVLAEDEEPVEFGKPLFKVDTSR